MIVGSIWHIMQRSNWAEQCCTQSLLMRRDVIIIIILHLFQCTHGPGSWAIAVRTCTNSIFRSVSIELYRFDQPVSKHRQIYHVSIYIKCVQTGDRLPAKRWSACAGCDTQCFPRGGGVGADSVCHVQKGSRQEQVCILVAVKSARALNKSRAEHRV